MGLKLAGCAALLLAAGSLGGEDFRRGERKAFTVRLSDGLAEVEWISASSFRFWRRWGARPERAKPVREDDVVVAVREAEGLLEFTTKHLRVSLNKETLRISVQDATGSVLLADAVGPRREGGAAVLERESPAGERFQGLGMRADVEGAAARGARIETETAFLMSSMGYGEHFRRAGTYVYQFGERRRVETSPGDELEYFFYYGPTPKEILEEHAAVSGGLREVNWEDFRVTSRLPKEGAPLPPPAPTWEGLRETLRQVLRASFSAILLPALDLSPWWEAPEQIRRRAAQLAAFLPVVYQSRPSEGSDAAAWLFEERERLVPYLASYGHEAQERGFPHVRPLAMQYAKDPEAAHYEDEYLLGDELLVAPILGPDLRRRAYLPMGIWTELHTNRRYQGRQVVEVEAGPDWIPVFARNGSIVPLAAGRGQTMTLHYFPRLAAEFFLYEEGSGALTQFHAAPAGELLRLEIEAAVDRRYEWVVHHMERCRQVRAGEVEYREAAQRAELRPGRWWHDPERNNLHIQTRAKAGTDHIIYVSF